MATSAEVKPFGTRDDQIPKEATVKIRQTPVRQVNVDVLRNPLTATLLGMTLGLLLLSLSHLRPFSGLSSWWPWSAPSSTTQSPIDLSSMPSMPSQKDIKAGMDQIKDKGSEYYRSAVGEAADSGVLQAGKETLDQARNKASEVLSSVKETVQSTGESMYNAATGGTGSTGGFGSTIESGLNTAQQAACNTADRARDIACNPSKYTGSAKDTIESTRQQAMDSVESAKNTVESARQAAMDTASETTESVRNRASEIYENARQKAADMLEAAKHTMTYPLHKTQETGEAVVESAKESVTNVRDSVENTAEQAKDSVLGAGERVKDSVLGAGQRVKDTVTGAKDTVLGAGERVKDTVLGAGERVKDTVTGVKDTVTGAGERVKDTLTGAAHQAKDSVTSTGETVKETIKGSGSASAHATADSRGPRETRIKVEVQDL